MKLALKEAAKAYDIGEVPVGAIIVIKDQIVSKGYNQVELLNDSTAHAEILALTAAFQALGTKYLPDASLFVTVEPCLMCCGALYWSKIGRVIFGATDDKNGYRRSTGNNPVFHPKTVVSGGVLAGECALLMQSFFKERR